MPRSRARLPYRNAFVSGASRGIGRALALRLADGGARVVICARGEDALEETRERIARSGGDARAVVLDVGDTERTAAVLRALDDEARFDLVVANAGVGVAPGADGASWEAIADACHVNFCGAAATLTALAPRMREERRGHLVGVSSLASKGALPGGSAAYCAPKAGLSMLLGCLRLDLAPHDVRVTAVHVGFVDTQMVAATRFFMPMMISAEACAAHILSRLPAGPANIDFPLPMALATAVHGALPTWLRERIARLGASYAGS